MLIPDETTTQSWRDTTEKLAREVGAVQKYKTTPLFTEGDFKFEYVYTNEAINITMTWTSMWL